MHRSAGHFIYYRLVLLTNALSITSPIGCYGVPSNCTRRSCLIDPRFVDGVFRTGKALRDMQIVKIEAADELDSSMVLALGLRTELNLRHLEPSQAR